MLRIDRTANSHVVFTLSGRMQTEDLDEVQRLIVVEAPQKQLTLNLRDVTLVNEDVVGFLADCEMKGINLESCPLHIRNWIDQKKRHSKRRAKKTEEIKLPKDS
jgi:hypothetical protein